MTGHGRVPVEQERFGTLPDGRAVTRFTLRNASGIVMKVLDFGGVITELHTRDRNGMLADIVLGYDTLDPYVHTSPYFGALIGRYANRINAGRFVLDGKTVQLPVNNGRHHLHGGPVGFDKVLWTGETFQAAGACGLALTYRSIDGEQGYPGNAEIRVVYELSDQDALTISYSASADAATPINLTQHSYFNLAGSASVLDHQLMIAADYFTPITAEAIPLGEHAAVDGTPFDFRSARSIGERIAEGHAQLANGGGYDHNFVLREAAPGALRLAAHVAEPGSGRTLSIYTEEPGIQFYSGNFLDGSDRGKGRSFAYRSALCLEPQHFPDSPNQPAFPDTILRPGQRYASKTKYVFGSDASQPGNPHHAGP